MEKEDEGKVNLPQAFSLEMLNPSLDPAMDFAEIAMDRIFSDDLIAEIPFVKTVFGIAKTGISIKEKIFLKKLLTFIQDFHSKEIEEKKLAEFRDKFNSESSYREKVTEKLFYVLDKISSNKKAKILSELFGNYISGEFDWNKFIEFSFVLEQLHPALIDVLHECSKVDFKLGHDHPINNNYSTTAMIISSGLGIQLAGPPFKLTQVGIEFYEWGIKGLFE